MTVDAKPTLLIVEDDLDIMEMLTAFRVQGYEVVTVNWGEMPSAPVFRPPDLVIMISYPPADIDGLVAAAICRTGNPQYHLSLTEKRTRRSASRAELHLLRLHYQAI